MEPVGLADHVASLRQQASDSVSSKNSGNHVNHAGGIMKLRSIVAVVAALAALSLGLAGCAATDVVAKVAKTSFKAVVAASGSHVTWSEEDQAWVLESPAGDSVAFSADFARNASSGGMADMDKPDVEFSFDATPFLAAGLDLAKLPRVEGIKYELEDGRFMYHFELGSDKFGPDAGKSIEAAFAELVRSQRNKVGYHEKLDHYGIKLGNGNMFEWAKDLSRNDKDIVWVLNPEPFIAAGVDPARIQGWILAKVETKDDAGKTVFVDKLLRPFDLE
jgi:hypothetical protein